MVTMNRMMMRDTYQSLFGSNTSSKLFLVAPYRQTEQRRHGAGISADGAHCQLSNAKQHRDLSSEIGVSVVQHRQAAAAGDRCEGCVDCVNKPLITE